jgi:hypothetical protein
MKPIDAQLIVQDYGAVLGESTATGVVRDINSLPCSKDQIKPALLCTLGVTTDSVMREHLRNGFVALADFQELLDEDVKALQIWNQMTARASESMAPTPTQGLAAAISKVGETVTALQKRTMSEPESLMKELKTAGF